MRVEQMENGSVSYDEQAGTFDARAGLSDSIAKEIASSVLRIGLGAGGGDVLDIGAGTGEIGRWLCSPDRGYVGLDSSAAMLDEFRARLAGTTRASLVCSDANSAWPVPSASVALVFGSRVFHLLEVDHVAAETFRVASADGAVLLMGRVKRRKDSVRNRMRARMRELLVDGGERPRDSEGKRSALVERCIELGAERIERIEAARWPARHRPIESIDSWRGKDSMGGIVPPGRTKAEVLDELTRWAESEFGDIQREIETQESYMIEGIRISGQGEGGS